MNQPEHGDDFAKLLAECDAAVASGDADKIKELLDQNPSLSVRLEAGRSCIELLQQLRPVRSNACLDDTPGADSTVNPAGTAGFGQLPARFGPFEVIRELGRGGSGIVFLACDSRCELPVALKIPRAEFLITDELRERSRQEGRLAAGLQHPHLVPIYEVGEIGPICYITSGYCPGTTLAQWLQQHSEPVTPGVAAQFLQGMAEAVQHAHSRGVLHRDLKPGNVLLTIESADDAGQSNESGDKFDPRDASHIHELDLDRVVGKITDFGLAKSLDGEGVQTRTGAILGTPSYMAPEQALGRKNTTTATDIYGLGAILYELLTRQPPFRGNSELETIEQLRALDPVPPSRIRRLPSDLETICLKCLEKEPHKRYASAAALAEDLRFFLDGAPIHARPVSAGGRIAKWTRRRPAVAGLLVALSLVTILGVIGIAWQWRRASFQAGVARQERDGAKQERATAEHQRNVAEANFQKARSVVDRLMGLGQDLLGQPGAGLASKEALEEALELYEAFLVEKGDDPSVLLDVAMACHKVASIQHDLGRDTQAEETCLRGIRILNALLERFPSNETYRHQLAVGHRYRANISKDEGDYPQARESYEEAIRIWKELLAVSKNADYQTALANAYVNWGVVLQADGKLDEAEQAFRQTIQIQRKLLSDLAETNASGETDTAASSSRRALYSSELALGIDELGNVSLIHGRLEEAEGLFQEALNTRQQLVADYPGIWSYRYYLARSYGRLGNLQLRTRRNNESEQSFRQAVRLLEELVANYPQRVTVRNDLAGAYINLGYLLNAVARYDESAECFAQAVKVDEKLAADFPDVSHYRERKAASLGSLGRVNRRAGHLAKASEALKRARKLRETGLQETTYNRSMIGGLWRDLARVQKDSDQLSVAAQSYREAIARFRDVVAEDAANASYRERLAATHLELAYLLKAIGRYQEELHEYRQAIEADPKLARAHNNLAWFFITCRDTGFHDASQALDLAKQAVELSPRIHQHWNTLGVAYYRCGEWRQSVMALDKSLKLNSAGDAEDWIFLAMAHWQLGDKEQARHCYDRASQQASERKEDELLMRFMSEAESLLGFGNRRQHFGGSAQDASATERSRIERSPHPRPPV